MKHKGSLVEINEERNNDLYNTYRKVLDAAKHINLDEITFITINSPAKRFYVSEDRATQVVCCVLKGTKKLSDMIPCRSEMYEEIIARYKILKESNPDSTIKELVGKVIEQPAPKFYITLGSAKVIIARHKIKWFERKRHQLRHLFM